MNSLNKPIQITTDPNCELLLKKEQFLVSANVGTWAVIYYQRNSAIVSEFTNKIKKMAAKRGLKLKTAVQHGVQNMKMEYFEWKKLFKDLRKFHGVNYFIIIDRFENNRHEIEAAEMLVSGIVTQFIKLSVVEDIEENERSTIEKIVFKMNQKVGGLNYSVNFNEAA